MIEFLPHEVEHRLRNTYHEQNPRGVEPTFREWLDQQGIQTAEEARESVESKRTAQRRHSALVRLANQIPTRYIGVNVDDPQIVAWAEELVGEVGPIGDDDPDSAGHYGCFEGPSLLILGPVGTGKTHQAYGLIRWLFNEDRFRDITITTAVELYASLRPRNGVDSEDVFAGFVKSDLLFIDDLGTGKHSEWVEEINYRLIDYRYNHKLCTIFTSNVPPAELSDRLGDRTASRLSQMCDRIVLKGQDRRKVAAA